MRNFGDRAIMGDDRVQNVTVEEKNLRNQITAWTDYWRMINSCGFEMIQDEGKACINKVFTFLLDKNE